MALRAVKPGERSRERTVLQAAKSGDQRDLLVAMRTRVAKAVQDPETPARDLASLTKRLMEIAKEIEAIDTREGERQPAGGGEDVAFDASAV